MAVGKSPSTLWQRSYLASIRRSLRTVDLLDSPQLAELAVEDACWSFNMASWRSRQPHWWQRSQMTQWKAEGTALFAEQDRLHLLALQCGLPT